MAQYAPKGRGTQGVKTVDTNALQVIGKIAGARVVDPEDDLTIISTNGQMLRTKLKEIKQASRATKGVRVINLEKGDSVAGIAIISNAELRQIQEENDKNAQGEK